MTDFYQGSAPHSNYRSLSMIAYALLGASIYGVQTAAMESSCSWSSSSVVRGHHVYKNVWTPSIGKRLQLRRQDDNDYDDHAVSIVKAETIVGHVRFPERCHAHFGTSLGMVEASDAR